MLTPQTNPSASDFGPHRLTQQFKEYGASIRLPKAIHCSKAIDSFMSARSQINCDSLLKATSAQLSPTATTDVQAFQAAINAALDSGATTPQKTKIGVAADAFKETINKLNKVLQQTPPPPTVEALAITTKLATLREDFEKAIKAQQAAEIAALTKEFDDTHKERNKTALQLQSDGDLNNARDELIAELTKEHENQKNAFLDPVNQELGKLHDDIAKDLARVHFLATIHDYQDDCIAPISKAKKLFGFSPDETKKEIKELINKVKEPISSTTISSGKSKVSNAKLRNINVNELKQLQTLTGRKIRRFGENGVAITIPDISLLNVWSHSDKKSITEDIRSITHAIRASGKDSIHYTIEHGDKNTAQKLAKMAFIEARKAGFDTSKIKFSLVVDGQQQKLSGKQLEQMLSKEEQTEIHHIMRSMKQALNDIRKGKASDTDLQALDDAIKDNNPTPTHFTS